MSLRSERDALIALRADAIERGMLELAIVYGWTVIRVGSEVLEEMIKEQRK